MRFRRAFAAVFILSVMTLAGVSASGMSSPAFAAQGDTNNSSGTLKNPAGSGDFGNSPATNSLTAQPAASQDPTSTPASDPNTVDQDSCAQKDGAFAWLMCPFFDGISHTFADGAKDLISNFLAVQPLQQSGPLYDTWNSIRTLANAAFVIIFLVIIFANTLQFDISSYAVKRMLPRLVAAAVLVQFSYVLVSLIVDSGNILGAGIGQLISSTVHGGATSSFDLGTLTENLVGGGILVALATVAWEMAFPLGLLVLITIMATILTLAFRYVILGVLIVLSPLAFAAWVLPNTERYFSTWLSTLIKLVLMYPIIIALLSVASNVNGLIPAAASTSGAAGTSLTTTIIKVLVFIACFAAIPRTFKWAGGAMAQAHGAIDGMRDWGHKKVRESDNWKNKAARTSSRQIERANKIEAGLRPFLSSRNPVTKGAGGAMMTAGSILLAARTGTSSAGRQRGSSQLVTNMAKNLESMNEATPRMMQRALIAHYATGAARTNALNELRANNAESLMEYTSRLEGRQALVRQLADKNLLGRDTMSAIQTHSRRFQRPEELQMTLRENGKNIRDNPAMFARFDRSDPTKTNPLGAPARMGDINGDVAEGFYKGMTAQRLRNDVSLDVLKLMTDHDTPEQIDMARQAARMFATVPHTTGQAAFHANSRTVIPPDRRATILEGMARNQAEFAATPDGQRLWDSIIQQIQHDMAADPTSHDDALRDLSPAHRAILGL